MGRSAHTFRKIIDFYWGHGGIVINSLLLGPSLLIHSLENYMLEFFHCFCLIIVLPQGRTRQSRDDENLKIGEL